MAPRRRAAADVQLLIASALTGLAGASFILISGRAVGLEAFAPMAQLWTIWSIAAATLLFAFQQWAIRLEVGRSVGFLAAMRGGPLVLAAAATLGTGTVALVARSTLFHTTGLFWPAAAAMVVVGTVAAGTVRGILAGAGRHGLLAFVIAADNVVRVAIGSVLVAVGADVEWYGLALVASYAVLVVGWSPVPGRTAHTGTGTDTDTGTGTLGSAATAGFLSHVALASPPIVVAFNGGASGTVSTLFLVLTAIRLPHLLLQAGAPRAGVAFQGWVNAGHHDRLARARLVILGGSLALALVAFGAGTALGDLTIGILFDIRGRVDALVYGAMAVAGVLSVGGSFASVLLVAQGRNRFLVSRWLVPLAVAAAAAVVLDVTTLGATATGLVVLHLVVLMALTLPRHRSGPATRAPSRPRTARPARPTTGP